MTLQSLIQQWQDGHMSDLDFTGQFFILADNAGVPDMQEALQKWNASNAGLARSLAKSGLGCPKELLEKPFNLN